MLINMITFSYTVKILKVYVNIVVHGKKKKKNLKDIYLVKSNSVSYPVSLPRGTQEFFRNILRIYKHL